MSEMVAYRQRCLSLIKGIDSEWEEYLSTFINNAKTERELVIGEPRSMIYQLRNPAVVIVEPDGVETHASSCVWLLNYTDGRRELVTPDETSGVKLDRASGRLICNFNALPTPIPDDVSDVVRISLRVGITDDDSSISWRLYSTVVSKKS